MQELYGKVVFRVNPRANKIEIKQAVEQLFDVKVASVRTASMRGKKKRVGIKSMGRTSDWKKAYVTLSEGEINFLDEL
jgi:large subunit ribosomal protein L23